MAQQLPQLFGIIPTSHPCITLPTSAPTPTSYIYSLPLSPQKPFSHITVFLLPGISLPPNTAAAVYISLPPITPSSPTLNQAQNQFKFLGGIGPGKESAVFKISGLVSGSGGGVGAGGEVDMDASDTTSSQSGEITLGISLESADSVSAQMAALQSSHQAQSSPSTQALVLARAQQSQKPDTLVLAQRIIKNAFNFLASFSGNVNGGVEVVPLKAFEEWWRKFEGRVRSDPGFLERDGD
ncbi:hypothetical protein EG329_005545 [Mollisiaceae sp. DMI_Dod_QoI]|nr:hypothetical protein EG329_005545 [Helotiales sp. DMI_Dod_QoI]